MNTKTQQQPGQIIDLVKVQQARRALPEQKTLNGLAETFKVLSNPNRLKIIHTLAQQEMCVSDLAALLDSTDSAVSHQLRVLRTMRLVSYRKEGKMAFYSLDDQHVRQLYDAGLNHLTEASQE
ncbi:MAG: helix-turn-helix transcriptional regulator [Candidatus Latescibacteria bacterium]|jgi:ArsR family transcriptional regulator, lead/cadmium/zinc/bismuth-responsive transcriptional repressor|nr:helix-turn-helix transcriptional regulator [Candidatus Latescibacterota bacterium]MBT4141082.1 helix-turn-helix transcriptional regulator [Candidatus Latescibacterota bacterium]